MSFVGLQIVANLLNLEKEKLLRERILASTEPEIADFVRSQLEKNVTLQKNYDTLQKNYKVLKGVIAGIAFCFVAVFSSFMLKMFGQSSLPAALIILIGTAMSVINVGLFVVVLFGSNSLLASLIVAAVVLILSALIGFLLVQIFHVPLPLPVSLLIANTGVVILPIIVFIVLGCVFGFSFMML